VDDGGGTSTAPGQQALDTNPLATAGNLVASFTYAGNINFNPGTNTIGAFFASGGGVISNFVGGLAANVAALNNFDLSTSGFVHTSVMEFLGSTASPIAATIEAAAEGPVP
jgi:hypothetical protein